MDNDRKLKELQAKTRQRIRELSRKALLNPEFAPASPIVWPNGETVMQVNDITTTLCENILLLAFYVQSPYLTMVIRKRRLVVSFTGGLEQVKDLVLSARLFARLIMALINIVGDRWTTNGELELAGYIPLRWGLSGDLNDYQADVRIRLEADNYAVLVIVRPENLPECAAPMPPVHESGIARRLA